ncbi:MAG: ABC transporter permease [Gemmataceae bacterium]
MPTPVWTLAKKDLRLLLRDARAMIVLLLMPLVFIFVLGVSLGEGFGQKPEDRLKVSVVVLDQGPPRFLERPAMLREETALLTLTPSRVDAGPVAVAGAAALSEANARSWFPRVPWSEMLLRDLGETADIKVELIDTLEEAERLVRDSKRAAVLVLGPAFSKRVERCSFLAAGWQETFALAAAFPNRGDPILLALNAAFQESQTALPLYTVEGLNPFYRDGIRLDVLDVRVLRDPTQQTASAIIDQVAQGSLIRVVMPWMIGRAFEKIADPDFLQLLANDEQMPKTVKFFLTSPFIPQSEKLALSTGLQNAIQNLFPKYNLTAKTWAALTKEEEHAGTGRDRSRFQTEGGGWLKRGSIRYQLLVPSYLVMFAFFLVLAVGWLFSSERRQGTLKRLRLAPLTTGQILLGKLLPCMVISLFQGFFLLLAGRLLFGMGWGPAPGWLALVVACTSFAAMGLALLIAAVARTETQVAIYGTLIVLVLAGLSGALMGDRSLMPENMQEISRVTPHAWALDAYRQLLVSPGVPSWAPNLTTVATSCLALTGFGVVFLGLAWFLLRLEL